MVKLPKELAEAFEHPETVKALTTVDEEGIPHTVFKGSLGVIDEETIAYMEFLETCRTQRNMVNSIWFKKTIAVSVFNPVTKVAYQIKGEPYKHVTSGPVWDKYLAGVRSEMPGISPACVWLITVKEVRNEDYQIRLKEEEKRRPGTEYYLKYMETRRGEK